MTSRLSGVIVVIGCVSAVGCIATALTGCGTGELEGGEQQDRGHGSDPDGIAGRKSDQSTTRSPVTNTPVVDAGATGSADAKIAADKTTTGTPSTSAFGMGCRHTACTPITQSGDLTDASFFKKGFTYKAEGRKKGPQGQCAEVVMDYFPSKAACDGIPFRQLPVAMFYGNAKSWGCLGWGKGVQFKTPQDVSGQFGKLCAQTRLDTGLGTRMSCVADLIALGGSGFADITLPVAQEIVKQHKDAIISIDLRFRAGDDYNDMRQIIDDIFSGNKILTKDFLKQHAVWLSLDTEAHVLNGNWGQMDPIFVNELCQRYRDKVKSFGHSDEKLACINYDYGMPSLVYKPGTLDPRITPVMMSSARELGLDKKEEYMDRTRKAYSAAEKIGCMFFNQPHLIGFIDYEGPPYKNGYLLPKALEKFGDKCDIIAYQ